MRIVFAAVLVLGIGLAGFAVYQVQSYIAQAQAALEQERAALAEVVETVDVLGIGRDAAYGEQITAADLVTIPWPKDKVPAGAFTDPAALFPEGKAPFRTVLRPMQQFEPILASKVTEPGEDAGITARLAPGMRAFAIKVDVTSGVSGFLRPGDRIDVYWTGSVGPSGDVTKLIQSGIRLIAVDQTADADPTNPAVIARTVTVEATPEQVAVLAQAQATGRLSLALVGARDDSVAAAVEVDMRRMLGVADESVPGVVEEPRRVCTIRTRRGSEVVEIPIPCTN